VKPLLVLGGKIDDGCIPSSLPQRAIVVGHKQAVGQQQSFCQSFAGLYHRVLFFESWFGGCEVSITFIHACYVLLRFD
jgi:hypothetical protein